MKNKKVYTTPKIVSVGGVNQTTKGKPHNGHDYYNIDMCNPGAGSGDLFMCGTPYMS